MKFWKCLGWQPFTCETKPRKRYLFNRTLEITLPVRPVDWMRIHKPDKDFLLAEAETDTYGVVHSESSEPVNYEQKLIDSMIAVLKVTK